MARSGRSLSLLLVLALWCGTGCAAANYSARAERSAGTPPAPGQALGMQDAGSLSQVTAVPADTAAVTAPPEDRGVNRTVVILVCLAAVGLLMALVAR